MRDTPVTLLSLETVNRLESNVFDRSDTPETPETLETLETLDPVSLLHFSLYDPSNTPETLDPVSLLNSNLSDRSETPDTPETVETLETLGQTLPIITFNHDTITKNLYFLPLLLQHSLNPLAHLYN